MKRGSEVELSSLKKDEGSMPVDKKEKDEEERRTKWKLISMEIRWPRGRRSKRLQECRVGECRRKYFRSDESFLYIYSVTSNDHVIVVRSLRTRRISSGRERRRRHQKAIGAPFQHGSRVKKRKTERKTHDSEDQREDEAAVTSGVIVIAEVNFDGKFQRDAHEGGRRERERVDHASLKPAEKPWTRKREML